MSKLVHNIHRLQVHIDPRPVERPKGQPSYEWDITIEAMEAALKKIGDESGLPYCTDWDSDDEKLERLTGEAHDKLTEALALAKKLQDREYDFEDKHTECADCSRWFRNNAVKWLDKTKDYDGTPLCHECWDEEQKAQEAHERKENHGS